MNTSKRERRVRQCEISFECLSGLIKQERYICNLPEDTQVEIISTNSLLATCQALLYSASFEEVKLGQEPPIMLVEYRTYSP